MPITSGGLSARVWRVTDTLPPHFTDLFERNLKRFAFQPIDVEKGRIKSMGWVNIRQVLDSRLTVKKTLFDKLLAVALRIDRITINQRLFRATLGEAIVKALRERKSERLTREQRSGLEEQVRMDLIKSQTPSMAVYEVVWHLEQGLVFFSATAEKLNAEFADLFAQTFNVSLEPQFPYLRAQRWARRQKAERALLELMPAPFSPRAPAEVIEVDADSGDDGENDGHS